MPNTIRDDSTIPTNDRVIDQNGLIARAWVRWFNWVKRTIIQILNGPMSVTQSQIVLTQANLGVGNVGLVIYVSDYAHFLRWTGTGWNWAPGATVSNFYAQFEPTGPQPAVDTGWVPADGTVYDVLQSDGTLVSVTSQTIADTYFRV